MKEKNNKKYILKKNPKILIFGISITLFIIFTILIKLKVTTPIDNAIESFVIGIRSNKLTNIMISITNLSRAYFLISISIILLFIIKNKRNAILIIINLITVFLTSQLLKFIFKRVRPDGEHLISAFGYSYPSGHAMVSMAYFSFILYLINQKIKNKLLKTILTIITSIIIFLIGFSRIYLGVHYTSDVIAGFIVSYAYLMIFYIITENNEVKL